MSSPEVVQGLANRPTAISPKAALNKRKGSKRSITLENSPAKTILKKQLTSQAQDPMSPIKPGGETRHPRKILSVDTGNLRGMIRQQQTVKNFIESAQTRL